MITAVSECCSPHVQVSFAEKARNACINTNWNTVDYKEINGKNKKMCSLSFHHQRRSQSNQWLRFPQLTLC